MHSLTGQPAAQDDADQEGFVRSLIVIAMMPPRRAWCVSIYRPPAKRLSALPEFTGTEPLTRAR